MSFTFSSSSSSLPPIIIGATGGSGTRLLKQILATANVFGGLRVNEAGDATDFMSFYSRYINPTLTVTRSLNYSLLEVPDRLRDEALSELQKALSAYCADFEPAKRLWMIKNPRSMYMLPFFAATIPQFRFLHLVRDGRDMATSSNQNQVLSHFECLFEKPLGTDIVVAAARLWSRANEDVADWGGRHLGDRYRLVRFEDLCAKPSESALTLYRWLGIPSDCSRLENIESLIHRENSIGRWRALLPDRRFEIELASEPGLRRFGYS